MRWTAAAIACLVWLALTAHALDGVSFSQRTYEVYENAGSALVEVRRSGALSDRLSVVFSTAEGTAVDGFDYRGVKSELHFEAGQDAISVPVSLFDNFWNDGSRTVLLHLHAKGFTSSALLRILDDEEGDVAGGASADDASAEAPYLRLFQRASIVLPTLTSSATATATATTTTRPETTTPACTVGCDDVCRERPYVRDECDVCGPPSDGPSPSADCHGTCFGNARNNSCGLCVGGETGLPTNAGRDLCGICFGDNTTCEGCDGVPNSGKVYDLCGVCDGNQTTCFAFIRIVPDSGPNVTDYNVHVIGAGFQHPDGTPRTLECIVEDMFNTSVPASVIDPGEASCDLNAFSSLGIKDFFLSIDGTILGPLDYLVYDNGTAGVGNDTIKVYIDTAGQEIIVPGTHFVGTATLEAISNGSNETSVTCRYEMQRENVTRYETGVIYNDTTVVCPVPETAVSQKAHLSLSFSGTSGPFTNFLEVHYYQYAPIALSARFLDEGNGVRATFNASLAIDQVSVTTLPDSLATCQAVLTAATIDTLGTNPSCVFTAGDLLTISLGHDSTLRPGDYLYFLNDTLREFGREFCDPLITPVLVDPPLNPPLPVAVITAPQAISQCAELEVSAAFSTGGGGHDLVYNWTITPEPTSAAALAVLESLKAGNVSTFTFPADSLEITTYTITLVVTNYLGVSSEPASVTVEVVPAGIPTVVIFAPSPLRVVSSEETELTPLVTLAPCAPSNATFNFTWTATPEIPALAGQEHAASVLFPRNSLTPRTQYNVTVTVHSIDTPSLSGQYTIVIDVLPPPLRLRVLGGGWRSIGEASALTIDVSLLDPSGLGGRVVDLRLSCTNVAPLASTNSCLVLDPNDPLRIIAFEPQFIRNVTTDASPVPQLFEFANFEAFQLIADPERMLYHFEVRATEQDAGLVHLTDFVVIEVRQGPLPYALLDTGSTDPTDFVVTRPLAISALLSLLPNATYEFLWTSLEGTTRALGFNNISLSTVDLSNPNLLNGPPNSEDGLLLRPEVLLPNSVYQFRLEIFAVVNGTRGEQVAYCTLQVVTSSIPLGGSLVIAPASGRAVFDDFIISLPGWSAQESQLPLTYSIRMYYSEDGFVEATSQRPGLLNTTMPNPTHGNVIRVIARIIQKNGAMSFVEQVIIVEPCTVTDTASLNVLENEFGRRSSELYLLGRWRDLQILAANFVGCLAVSNDRLNGTSSSDLYARSVVAPADTTVNTAVSPRSAIASQVSDFLQSLDSAVDSAGNRIPPTANDVMRKVCVLSTLSEASASLPAEKSAALLVRLLGEVVAFNSSMTYGMVMPDDFMGCLLRAEENVLLARPKTTVDDLKLFWQALDVGAQLYQTGQACRQSPSTVRGAIISFTASRDRLDGGHAVSSFTFPDTFGVARPDGSAATCLCASSLDIDTTVYANVPPPSEIKLEGGNHTNVASTVGNAARALFARILSRTDDPLYDTSGAGNATRWQPSDGNVHTMALRDCSRSTRLGVLDDNGREYISDLGGHTVEIRFEFDAADNIDPARLVCAYLDYDSGTWSQEGVSLLRADSRSAQCLTTHLSDFVVLQNVAVPPAPSDAAAPLPFVFPPWLIVLIALGGVMLLGSVAMALFLVHRKATAPALATLNYVEFAAEHAGIAAVPPPVCPPESYARRVRPPPYALPPDYVIHMLGADAVAEADTVAVRVCGAAMLDSLVEEAALEGDEESDDDEYDDEYEEEDGDSDGQMHAASSSRGN